MSASYSWIAFSALLSPGGSWLPEVGSNRGGQCLQGWERRRGQRVRVRSGNKTGANLGYGRANNIGMAEATGKHLLILNPDTLPQPGSLQHLVDFLSDEQNAGIVSPRLLNPDGSVQSAAFRFPTLMMAALDLSPLPTFIPGRFACGFMVRS